MKEIVASIVYFRSAKSVWDELNVQFKYSNDPHVYHSCKELITINQATLSVEAYYTKLKTIWQNLCDYRPAHDCVCREIKKLIENFGYEFIMIFLMRLNESLKSANPSNWASSWYYKGDFIDCSTRTPTIIRNHVETYFLMLLNLSHYL